MHYNPFKCILLLNQNHCTEWNTPRRKKTGKRTKTRKQNMIQNLWSWDLGLQASWCNFV